MAGIRRVVIFDSKQTPIFILRYESMPKTEYDDGSTGASSNPPMSKDTIEKYIGVKSKRVAARNFCWAARSHTIADGRSMLQLRKLTDIFVTEHGQSDEPVLGWVPDYNLLISS